MKTSDFIELARVIAVIALIVAAAALATPPDRLPLALRGLRKILHRDDPRVGTASAPSAVPVWKRLLAFLLVVAAALLACF